MENQQKVQLKNMTCEELEKYFLSIGEKKFRASQVFGKIHRGILSFDEITELPRSLREKLAQKAQISSVQMLQKQESRTDGTRKYLFGLRGGHAVESVFMKYRYGNTACISSQAGWQQP